MISGRSFAEICKWVFDPRYPNAPKYSFLAGNGDRIFLNGDYVFEVAKTLGRFPLKRCVFVVHNSDQPFDQAKFQALSPFALHVYAVNNVVIDPKVTTIPLGFADKQVAWASSFVAPPVQRDIFAYANFMPRCSS